MMKKVRKTIATLACAALLVVGSVAATMAYLTSEDSVVNTFTVGDVQIKLDEAVVNADGQPLDKNGEVVANVKDAKRTGDTVTGNAYHLLPGGEYVKDPTVTVLKNSDDCYVRMLVKLDDTEITALKNAFPDYVDASTQVFLLQNLVDWNSTDWTWAGFKGGVYQFRYKDVVPATGNNNKVLEPLFTKITIPGGIDNEHLGNLKLDGGFRIEVTAQAIQEAGFEGDAVGAWAAFEEQHKVTP